jgi:hypothetical protein
MQHTHVKRKEYTMNRTQQDDYYDKLEQYRRLAHRERARAMSAMFVSMISGLSRLLGKAMASLKPRHPARWIARLG